MTAQMTQHGASYPHTDHVLRFCSVISTQELLVMVKYMKNTLKHIG